MAFLFCIAKIAVFFENGMQACEEFTGLFNKSIFFKQRVYE
jgi:hypothetical protein